MDRDDSFRFRGVVFRVSGSRRLVRQVLHVLARLWIDEKPLSTIA